MTKYAAYGAVLAIGDDVLSGTPNYTTIAQVSSISGPSISMDPIDVTTHDSSSGFREFVEGLVDPGEVSFDLVFDPDEATHQNASGGVLYELHQRTKKAYRVSFTDATPATVAFDAFVTAFEPEMAVDGAQTASLTLKITGTLTWA